MDDWSHIMFQFMLKSDQNGIEIDYEGSGLVVADLITC